MRTLLTGTLLLALGAMLPQPTAANELCTSTLMACASVHNVQVVGSQLRFQVTHTTSDGYIRKLLLKYKDPHNPVTSITASGVSGGISWGPQSGDVAGQDWDNYVRWGGGSGIFPGQTATIVVTFNSPAGTLENWAAGFQSLGPDGDSEWATTPEPVTLILLGSGLAGIGGAAALRRRRRGTELLDG